MTMSEFEETDKDRLPPDFSAEEAAFAQELQTWFALPDEELPPYFVQTLLEAEDPRFGVLEPGFEHKTRARVLRRLHMPRRLFPSRRSLVDPLIRKRATRGSLVAVLAVCLFVMLVTVGFSSPAFAEGMAILLQGTRSGVYQVHSYPNGVRAPASRPGETHPRQISLAQAQHRLHFPISWPQVTPRNAVLESMTLYEQPQQTWADGPILELHYGYTTTPQDGGDIAIREFKPQADVLLVVQSGAAHAIQLKAKAGAQAIYVDGQWVRHNFSHRWVYGGRSELLYERDGVVFWIVGDQRDGVDEQVLLAMAQSLQVVNMSQMLHVGVEMTNVTPVVGDTSALFAGDVIAVVPDGKLQGPYLLLVGPDQPPQEQPIQKHVARHAS